MKKQTATFEKNICIGDEVYIERGALPALTGKLVELYVQGWWKWGVILLEDGTYKGFDSDVHVLKRAKKGK